MSISTLTVWEVRTTGADTNGGGFVAGASGTDFSQQNSAQVVIDNSTIVCSTPAANSNTLTFVSGYTPTAADIGNIAQITGGTNITAGFYQITAQTSTTWTLAGAANLTTAGGAGSAIIGNMGGSLATPAKAGAAMIAGNRCWIKNGTYSGASGPLMTLPSGAAPSTTLPWTWVSGYNSTRGDITHGPLGSGAGQGGGADNRPTFFASNVAVANMLLAKSNSLVDGLIFDLNGLVINGYTASGGNDGLVRGCLAKNVNVANAAGFSLNQVGAVEYCEVTGTSGAGFGFQMGGPGSMIASHAHAVGYGVFLNANAVTITECLLENNGHNGILSNNMQNCVITKNTIVGNTAHGIENTTLSNFFPVYIKDNIIADNGGAGIKVASASGIPYGAMFDGNTFFGNTGGNVVNAVNGGLTSLPYTAVYDQLASIDPVVSHAVGGNFAPVVTTPGPVGKTWLSQWPGNVSTTNYADMGAVQHFDSGGFPSAAQIASATWQDLFVSSDFSTPGSPGALFKSWINSLPLVAPGTAGGLPTVDASNNIHGLQTTPPLGTNAPANWINSAAFAAGATLPVVNLVNTLTTYTGNTPQTGDCFLRIGANGVGLTQVALATPPPTAAMIANTTAAAILRTPANLLTTDGSGDVTVSGGAVNAVVTDYATGKDPATLVLDAPQSAHKIPDSIGGNIRDAAGTTGGLTTGVGTTTPAIFPPEANDTTGTPLFTFTLDTNGNRISRTRGTG